MAGGDLYRFVFTTRFGDMTVVWSSKGGSFLVRQIIFHNDRNLHLFTGLTVKNSRELDDLEGCFHEYFDGQDVTFSLDDFDIALCPPFQKSVLLAEYGIPRGYVSTYGRIARHIGSPGACRAVGTALAANPFPVVIPCHRAVRSDGRIGGYQGGVEMKLELLRMEGVSIDRRGRVDLRKLFY